MLTGILNFLFSAILLLLGLASWVVLIYVLMALFIPQHRYTLQVRRFVEPVLSPIRLLLQRLLPKLSQSGVDFSPLAIYLLIQIASWLIRLLRSVLL